MEKQEYQRLVKAIGSKELTDAEREKADGNFLALPSGKTHYVLEGTGEPCVLVPGYATPYYLYDKVAESLVQNGYQVLRYDLMGRGLSERVKTDYTPEFFATQLQEITEAVLGNQPFYLFGTSMGGSITSTFATLHPDKVKKLILLAPAGMDSFQPPFYMKLADMPLLGDLIFAVAGVKLSMGGCAKELLHADQTVKDDYVRKFAHDAQYKGLARCLLSSLRHTILKTEHTTENYKKLAEKQIPTLVLWGTLDATMPYMQIDRMKEVLPEATFVTLEDSGHIFLYDEGERTMEQVLPFLKG